jgi:hypothetical protein
MLCLKRTGILLVICRLTCIYLACKVEESHVSAEELGKGIQQDPQVVLKNEMIVLQVCTSYIPSMCLWLY